jgi:predicted NBD/HSP70 family sugar kinase
MQKYVEWKYQMKEFSMTVISKSKCTLSQQIKRSKILRIIREQEHVTRETLVHETGMSFPVVARITKELINNDLVQEIGKDPSEVEGRKPSLLGIRKNSNFLVGVDIGSWETKGVLTNFDNQIIHRFSALTPRLADGAGFIQFMKDFLHTLIADAHVEINQIKGVGLAVGGSLDIDRGVVLYFCQIAAMKNLDLVTSIQQDLGVPVYLTNAQAMWAMSECEKAKSSGLDNNFLVVFCSYGLACVALIEGKSPIGYGHTGCRDFGHITCDNEGPACHCGLQGCLEAYASGWAIGEKGQKMALPSLLDMVGGREEMITAKEVFSMALRGDSKCIGIIQEAGVALGQMLAIMTDYYSPQRLIFTGGLVTDSTLYFDAAINTMRRRMVPSRFHSIQMQVTSLDKYAGALGITHMITNKILNAPIEDLIRVSW